jgi:hypothetical protein
MPIAAFSSGDATPHYFGSHIRVDSGRLADFKGVD